MSSTPATREEARKLLVDHLERERRNGERSAWLGERSREFLRELFLFKKNGGVNRVAEPSPGSAARTPAALSPSEGHPPTPTQQKTITPAPSRKVAGPERPNAPAVAVPKGDSKADRIERLRNDIMDCEICTKLETLRDELVFSTGNPDAEIMFVGEAPGFEEEKKGEPFVGPAGQLLTKIIETMGLRRDQVYISNIVKFRPRISGASEQGSRNRKPTAHEMAMCLPYLQAEVAVVEPRAIVALGATAIEGLLGEETSVAKARGDWHQFRTVPFRGTYHPSYLLRNESKTERRKLWVDMLAVMEHLGMPIDEKQRNFFKG